MLNEITNLFIRDIDRLIHEIEGFKNEDMLWSTSGDIANSPGNLAMHIVGNLSHFIGAHLGGTSYQRNRTAEFESKHIPARELINQLTETKEVVAKILQAQTNKDLNQNFPEKPFNEKSIHWVLLQLYGHLNYHLGQINYYRRK